MRAIHAVGIVIGVAGIGAWMHLPSTRSVRTLGHDTERSRPNAADESSPGDAAEPAPTEVRVGHSASISEPVEMVAPTQTKPAAAEPLSPEEKEALIERTLVEAYPANATLRFDEALESQAVNPAWSVQVTQAANQLLQDDALRGTKLSSVDCRATLCRIRVVHQDIDAEKAFWHSNFTADGPWSGHLQGGPMRLGADVSESFIYFANKEGSKQYAQIDAQITEDTELAVSLALEERGVSADSG